MDGSVLEEKSSCWDSISLLNWNLGLLNVPIIKTASKKIGTLICSVKFLFPVLDFYFYKSIIQPCIEYCCHVWTGTPSRYLDILDELQKRICRAIGPSLAASLEPLALYRNATSFLTIGITFTDVHLY